MDVGIKKRLKMETERRRGRRRRRRRRKAGVDQYSTSYEARMNEMGLEGGL